MNRAVARRTFFENGQDMRRFLAGLARTVRAGLVEVHAFALLTTHFHMLVRSPVGQLSAALHAVQLGYVRYFNRSRRRDGSLVRGRFRSILVESMLYRRLLVAYIDANPVRAGLAAAPGGYRFGSAAHYRRPTGPPWLCRDWVEASVRDLIGAADYDPERYEAAFPSLTGPVHDALFETGRRGDRVPIDLDRMVGNVAAVRSWMRRKAALADGTSPGHPIATPCAVARAVDEALAQAPGWRVETTRRRSVDGWRAVRILLLRRLAGLRLADIARLCGSTESAVSRDLRRLREIVRRDDVLGERMARTAHRALRLCYGPVLARGDR